ncbi:MAG: hypothetical protein B2I17_03210 [Thermoplasmatales archaeon B_DKE]|nr:MAG: hypothetical protein B2I17_03210 [Thermoplasmatales archaeon B_DKE]
MISFATANSTTSSSGNVESSLFVIAILVLFVIRRVYRGINGRQFRTSRVFMIPVIYTLLLLFSFFSIDVNYLYDASLLLLIIPGIVLGNRFGNTVKFFEKDKQIFYKRSQFILVFWLASLIVRESLVLLFPTVVVILLGVDALLSLTTGLIIGESIQVHHAYKKYVEKNYSDTETGE